MGLEILNVENNKIKIVDADIAKLTYLRELDLSGNLLTNLPDELLTLERLVRLNIASNGIRMLSEDCKPAN